MQMIKQLFGVDRCPHCGIANPLLVMHWKSERQIPRADGKEHSKWAIYFCTTCGSGITAKGIPGDGSQSPKISEIFPKERTAHEDIPDIARQFLQQAFETLHAPDAAAVMAGSAVDAMLKEKGYEEGSLYTRIDKALEDNVLTQAMADWAHEVRLGSNRPRHADAKRPHVSREEAEQSVEFAEALANFLFVLTARIQRGIEGAKKATENP